MLRETITKNVSECKKLRSLIKAVVGRKITILSKLEYDNIRIEYGEIISKPVIPKGYDAVYESGRYTTLRKFPIGDTVNLQT